LRVRGSGQPLAGSAATEKRKPLVSGDVIMIGGPFLGGAFARLLTPGGFIGREGSEGGVATLLSKTDPLLEAKAAGSDVNFFVIRNVKA
jgi:hypothetical protein